ncbi:hypothetical protein Tco_0281501 [Tanacetum coccineum]
MVAYLQKSEGSEGFHQIIVFLSTGHIKYALTKSPTIYVSLIEQFWQIAFASTPENREMEITATIDGKVKVVSKASIRRHLKLEDYDGISTLPNAEIFEQLALMSLEEDLKQTKKVYGNAYTKLILKEKKLEKTIKTSQARRRAKIVVSNDEEDEEDSSKQGRSLIKDMDLDAAKVLADAARIRRVENVHTYTRRRTISTGSGGVSTTSRLVSTTGMSGVSTASRLVSTVGMAQEVEINIPLPVATKDKGKAVMQESEPPKKIKKRVQIQMSIDEELAQKLHEEEQARFNDEQEAKFNEEQEQEKLNYEVAVRIQEELDESKVREWLKVAADEDLVQHLQAGEKYSEEDLPRKLVELVNQRKKFFAQQRAEAKRNKPMTPAQQKAYMSTYIKNQEGGYSIKKLKSLSFEQIGEALGSVQEQSDEEPKADELSQEQLQQLMIIDPEEGMNVEALQTKYPIIDWEVYSEDTIKFWKIIRVGNYTEVYQVFEDMLKNFDRDDLVKLWSLVHERFNSTKLTDDKAKELWVELKRLFKPDENDTLWKIQRYMHDPLTWKLYDTCGVHHVSTERGHDIFMLVEKDYPLTRALMTLMLCNKLRVDEYSEMANELLRKIFILANRPRQ